MGRAEVSPVRKRRGGVVNAPGPRHARKAARPIYGAPPSRGAAERRVLIAVAEGRRL
jgi:hypothetical protein